MTMRLASPQGALLLLLLVSLPVALLAVRQGSLRVDRDNSSMKSVDSRSARLMERRIAEFGEDHIVLLGFERGLSLEAASADVDLPAIARELERVEGVGRAFPVDGVPEDLRLLAVEALGDGRSGGYAAAVERIVEAARAHLGPGLRLRVTGQPVAELAIAGAIEAEQRRVVPLLAGGLLALLLLLYRHAGIAFAALAPAGLGIAALGGLYALVGAELDPVSSLLRPVILSVGVAGAVHLVEGYRTRRASGLSPERAASETRRDLFLPTLLTAATTAAGFLALATSEIPAVVRFGLFAALGAALTALFSLLVTPALLLLLARGPRALPDSAAGSRVPSRAQRFAAWIARRRRWVLTSSAALVALAGVFCALGLRADTDPIRLLPASHAFRQDTDRVAAALGGIEVFDVMVPPESVHASPLALAKLVAGVLARAEVVRLAGMPRTSTDGTRLVTALLRPGGTREREALFAELEAELGGERGDAALVTGTTVQVAQDSGRLVRGQLRSIAITLSALFLVIAVAFRSWRTGLLGLVPNVVPCVLLYGAIAALGRPLSVASAMIGSVMLGLIVDNTIHFLYRQTRARRRGARGARAIAETLHHVGRPTTITSLVLGGGFALGVLGTLETTREFSALAAATTSLALLADLVLLPALLVGRAKDEPALEAASFREESEVSVA